MARPAGNADPDLARALRQIREERKISRESIAHGANVSLTTISSIERGKSNPTWMTVRGIANALGISMTELIARVEGRRSA
jgi:transcriptional regulator with XRE-family HTH domain